MKFAMWKQLLLVVPLGLCSNLAVSGTETCPSLSGTADPYNRQGSFTDAVAGSCRYREGNTVAADINADYNPPGDFVELDETTSDDNGATLIGNGGLLTISNIVTTANTLTGDWSIDASLWTQYDSLAFSTHHGNGSGSPDSWSWLITDGQTSGTWSVTAFSAAQWNGFSNAKLYGGSQVPLPAAAWLFGSAIVGFIGLSRRKKARAQRLM